MVLIFYFYNFYIFSCISVPYVLYSQLQEVTVSLSYWYYAPDTHHWTEIVYWMGGKNTFMSTTYLGSYKLDHLLLELMGNWFGALTEHTCDDFSFTSNKLLLLIIVTYVNIYHITCHCLTSQCFHCGSLSDCCCAETFVS